MQVSNPNNVKIYNLSAGKSLPEWLSDRKKRSLQKNDIDLRRRINLIQDFEMPTVSTNVAVTPDKQYIFAAGVYKPRIRCYDMAQMSMKFERCLDAEVIKFRILSEDYSKVVFLQDDRYVEFHSQMGRYFRTRIPKFGRDFHYHYPSCDLFFVGASPEIVRLNLELGRFMSPLKTNAVELNCCDINPHHGLFTCGTTEGKVECWDPRTRNQVGQLDCAIGSIVQELELEGVPEITSLKYRDALTLAVGTSAGHILLYDIRSDKPLLVKDHQYGLPIKSIAFHEGLDVVLSIDSKILKLWHRDTGKPFTSIEPGVKLNDLCVFPDSGLLFMANEAPKVLTYYIPSLGPAPKWCSFLDNLTEELEETDAPQVYDDYKFLTRQELDELGLSHLIGSNLLRAYMHGFFIDIRLYHKAKSIVEPFAYSEYRKNKIKEKIEEARANRVRVKKLPKVNKNLAERLMEEQEEQQKSGKKKGKKETFNLLGDSRFAAMFSNPDFQVDPESEEYRLLNPVVSKLEKDRRKRQEKQERLAQQFEEINDELEGRPSSEDSSSDDEHTWTKELKKQHKQLSEEAKAKKKREREERELKPKFYEIKEGEEFHSFKRKKKTLSKKSLAERVADEDLSGIVRHVGSSLGAREMVFSLKKNEKEKHKRHEAIEHHAERRKLRRSAGDIAGKQKPKSKFWMGKKVS